MRLTGLVKTDIKNIFRDPSLIVIFIVPVLLIVLLRIVPPLIESYFPEAIEYRPLILGTFSLLISALAGFLLAFVMLDEKDQQLFSVFKVMPFSFGKLIALRVLTMLVSGFCFCLILIAGSGLMDLGVLQMITLALLCSLSGPANTLLIVSIANNKIEGSTYFKGLNMFIMAPLAAMFIAGPIKYLVGVLPFFWVFISFTEYQNPVSFYLHAGIGLVINALYLFLSYWLFLTRNK